MHRRVTAAVQQLDYPYEFILVNDGSRDRTWELMQQLADQDPHLVCVNLSRNHGHQLALTAGLSVSRGDRVLILDADLQDPPELLPRMLAIMDTGADVVYGQRQRRAGESLAKTTTAALFYRLINRLTETPIPVDTGDFRLISRRALDVLLAMPERRRFIRGMVSWIGFRQEPLLYDRDARYAGETKYPLSKMIRFAVDAITSFSVKPLVFASIAGLATLLLAFVLFVATVASWVWSDVVPAGTGIMSGVAFLSGIQLLALGVIGEYLGRLYEQSKGRPLFIIDRIHSSSVKGRLGGVRETVGGWSEEPSFADADETVWRKCVGAARVLPVETVAH